MLILTIRTDKPESELGLFEDSKQLDYTQWPAHRELAETIHLKISELLRSQKTSINDIGGIIAFQGPGSFTGLRIGLSVANALASGLGIPVVATREPEWISTGIKRLQNQENDEPAQPHYGAPVHITAPKH
jgi:tRNA threonylcarbamoyladenosine biosynthesis protein TsaB